MGAPGQIGIYWGTESFSLVETVDGQITNILNVPFDTSLAQDIQEETPDDLKFPTIIQKTLEFRSIKSRLVNLSIPTNDLIFRSFIIPNMNKSEVRGVIEFEVTKYIPIKLDDLVYTYHTVPFFENNQKNLRVLFVAIKRSRLEEMVDAFEQAGLTLKNIEPAPVCLIHLLKNFHLLKKRSTTAILQTGSESSELIVVEDEILHFMRKLNVSIGNSDIATLQTSLINETGVSFNFYNRQNPGKKIDTFFILSEQEIPNIEASLTKELGVSVSIITLKKFLPVEEYQTISHINALGATLRKEKFSPKFFDLSQEARELQRSGKDPLELIKRYGALAGTAAACLFIIGMTVFLSNKMLAQKKAALEKIKEKMGPYHSLSISDLTEKRKKLEETLTAYTEVQTRSYISTVLAEIPKLLPDGVWLEEIKISDFQEKRKKNPKKNKLEIQLRGKIYSADANEQFSILNAFISNLKHSVRLNKFYDDVKRKSADRVVENDYVVTSFNLICL